MYWRDYDLTYQADGVSWAGLRSSTDSLISNITNSDYIELDISRTETIIPSLHSEKTISLFGDQPLNVSIMYPLVVVGVNNTDTLQTTVTVGSPALKLYVDQAINPTITKSVYIESNTEANTKLYPNITENLISSLYGDETLSISIGTLNPIAYNFGEDIIIPMILDSATSVILQDTYLKRLASSGWDAAAIYVKESDGSWSSKPIYMKQLDKSWV